MSDGVFSKNLTRREFLAKSGAAVVAASSLPLISKVAKAAEADQITVSIQSFAHEAVRTVIEEFKFTENTGIRVQLEPASSGTEDIAKLTTYFRSGVTPYDVISGSDEASPGFAAAGWLEPLDDALPSGFWNDFPSSMDDMLNVWFRKDGATYRIPHEFAFSLFWYRKDWLDDLGLQAPKTWDEMVEVGKALTTGGRWGVGEALGKGGYIYVYMAYLTVQAGGNLFEFDEGTRTAMQFLHDMIYKHKVMSKSTLNQTYDQINQEYLNDRIGMMRQWPYFYSVTRDAKDWYAEGKAEVALPPAGPDNGKVWVGGHGWIIPKFTKKKAAAKEFLRFITSAEVAPRLAELQSWFVLPRNSIMAVHGNSGLGKYLKEYSDNNRFAPRPFHPKVNEAQSIVEDAAHAFLSGQMSLDQALKFGKSQIASI